MKWIYTWIPFDFLFNTIHNIYPQSFVIEFVGSNLKKVLLKRTINSEIFVKICFSVHRNIFGENTCLCWDTKLYWFLIIPIIPSILLYFLLKLIDLQEIINHIHPKTDYLILFSDLILIVLHCHLFLSPSNLKQLAIFQWSLLLYILEIHKALDRAQ